MARTIPGVLRATRRSASATTRRTSRTASTVSFARAAAPGPPRGGRLRRARADAGRPRVRLGARTASTGWSPPSPRRTPAACWCPSTPATPAHEVADVVDRTGRRGSRGRRRLPRADPDRRPAGCERLADACAPSSTRTSPTSTAGRRPSRPRSTRSPTAVSRRRRRRHPLHLRHHRPPKGAMSAHRQTVGVAPRLGRARRRHRRRPLPGGQPVLPLLRLQGRDHHRPADRRDALPGRDLRPRRDDGPDRVRADHRPAGRTDDLHVAAQRSRPRRPRPLVAAARGHRRRRRARGADRADARPSSRSTRSSPPSG